MKRTKLRKKKAGTKTRRSNILLALGAILLAFLLNRVYLRYRPIPLTETVDLQTQVGDIIIDKPDNDQSKSVIYPNLSIPKLNLTLPIYEAIVSGGKWQTTTKGLSHASSSAPLGHTGNTVIYGHNWPNMLKHLPTLMPGDEIIINLGKDTTHTYLVTYAATISPDDTSLTNHSKDTRLTLYTCTGLLDSLRYVVVAHPN